MNAFAKRWVEALRSGEYKQGRGQLRRGNKFCCFGVACDLFDHDAWYDDSFDGQDQVLPLEVRDALGLRSKAGIFSIPIVVVEDGEERHWECLAELNDHGWTFEEIADFIESEPAGLFRSDSE